MATDEEIILVLGDFRGDIWLMDLDAGGHGLMSQAAAIVSEARSCGVAARVHLIV